MKTETIMTLRAAIAFVQGNEYLETWTHAERVIVQAGICPSCIQAGHRSRLNRWEPGNNWEHAGRICPDCEEFFICGEQPEYEPDPWAGDADHGL
jgi:hypothetical protein